MENKLRVLLKDEVYIIPITDERRGMKLFPVVEKASLIALISDLEWKGLYRLENPVLIPSYPRNVMGKFQRAKLVEVVESIVFSAD